MANSPELRHGIKAHALVVTSHRPQTAMQRQLAAATPLLQQAKAWGWQSIRALAGAAEQGTPYKELSIGKHCSKLRSRASARTHFQLHAHESRMLVTGWDITMHACRREAAADSCTLFSVRARALDTELTKLLQQACPRSHLKASGGWP